MKPSLVLAIAISGFFGAAHALLASSLCAEVVDVTEAPLPNATINIVSLSDPSKRASAITGSNGKACVSQLPEGLYAVEAGLTGFLNVRYYPVRIEFPNNVHLSFRLPFGDIGEGGIEPDAIVSGTLEDAGHATSGIKICLLQHEGAVPTACTVTNDLGQYALTVPPGKYRVEVTRLSKTLFSGSLDLSSPGSYVNKLRLSGAK
jgi:Carboxypeptidase regulatory-like domain